jgi:hypothetical protein
VLSALERARNDLLTDAVIADRVTKLRQLLPVGAPASP